MMFGLNEFEPGTAAPVAGTYELRHVLGKRTGLTVDLVAGEQLPSGPRAWFWSRAAKAARAKIDSDG
jgi:hypothetical protein